MFTSKAFHILLLFLLKKHFIFSRCLTSIHSFHVSLDILEMNLFFTYVTNNILMIFQSMVSDLQEGYESALTFNKYIIYISFQGYIFSYVSPVISLIWKTFDNLYTLCNHWSLYKYIHGSLDDSSAWIFCHIENMQKVSPPFLMHALWLSVVGEFSQT